MSIQQPTADIIGMEWRIHWINSWIYLPTYTSTCSTEHSKSYCTSLVCFCRRTEATRRSSRRSACPETTNPPPFRRATRDDPQRSAPSSGWFQERDTQAFHRDCEARRPRRSALRDRSPWSWCGHRRRGGDSRASDLGIRCLCYGGSGDPKLFQLRRNEHGFRRNGRLKDRRRVHHRWKNLK